MSLLKAASVSHAVHKCLIRRLQMLSPGRAQSGSNRNFCAHGVSPGEKCVACCPFPVKLLSLSPLLHFLVGHSTGLTCAALLGSGFSSPHELIYPNSLFFSLMMLIYIPLKNFIERILYNVLVIFSPPSSP